MENYEATIKLMGELKCSEEAISLIKEAHKEDGSGASHLIAKAMSLLRFDRHGRIIDVLATRECGDVSYNNGDYRTESCGVISSLSIEVGIIGSYSKIFYPAHYLEDGSVLSALKFLRQLCEENYSLDIITTKIIYAPDDVPFTHVDTCHSLKSLQEVGAYLDTVAARYIVDDFIASKPYFEYKVKLHYPNSEFSSDCTEKLIKRMDSLRQKPMRRIKGFLHRLFLK